MTIEKIGLIKIFLIKNNMTKLKEKRTLKKAKKSNKAEKGYKALENQMYSSLDKSASYTHSSSRGNAQNQSTRYVAKKAGAEALGGDLKPNAFYIKSKVASDEKSGKDVIISKSSGKGYMSKSKVVDGKVESKYRKISKGRAKIISKRIDRDISKK